MQQPATDRDVARRYPARRAAAVATRGGEKHRPAPRTRAARTRQAREREVEQARRILLAMALVLVVVAVFLRSVFQDFSPWDDKVTVYGNPYLNPVTLGNVAHFWIKPYQGLYIPLSYTVFAAITLLSHSAAVDPSSGSHLDPLLYHLANVALHSANAVLVFLILRDLVRSNLGAIAGAGLFAIQPLQVESVAWIPELRGLLCGLFSLLALRYYLQYARAEREGQQRLRPYLIALVLGVLALLCKPAAIALPLIFLALDRWCIGRPWRKVLVTAPPLLVPALAIVVVTNAAQPLGPDVNLHTAPVLRLFVAGDALAFYLAKLVAPIPLAVDYGRTPSLVLHNWWGYATWLLPAAVALLIWARRQSLPWLVAAGAVGFAALLPNLGLVPFAYQYYSTVADRYAYLAMLGPALALAFALARVRGVAIPAAVGAVLLAFATLTLNQIGYWDSGLTLWSQAVAVGGSDTAYVQLGGQQNANHLPAAAMDSYRQALRVNPQNPDAYEGLGTDYLLQGDLLDAVSNLRHAIRFRPDYYATHYMLGVALVREGNKPAGLAQIREAIRLHPSKAVRQQWEQAIKKLQ